MDCRILTDLPLALIAQSDPNEGISSTQIIWIIAALAILIVPFMLGGFLAKRLKMPNLSTQLGFVLLAVIASSAVLANRLPGLGVDLRGGTIIVYEIDPTKSDPDSEGGSPVKSKDLIGPLTKRINPSGTREIVLRPYGDTQIEVIVPEVDQREVAQIEVDAGRQAGILTFCNRCQPALTINGIIELGCTSRRRIRQSRKSNSYDAKSFAIPPMAGHDWSLGQSLIVEDIIANDSEMQAFSSATSAARSFAIPTPATLVESSGRSTRTRMANTKQAQMGRANQGMSVDWKILMIIRSRHVTSKVKTSRSPTRRSTIVAPQR